MYMKALASGGSGRPANELSHSVTRSNGSYSASCSSRFSAAVDLSTRSFRMMSSPIPHFSASLDQHAFVFSHSLAVEHPYIPDDERCLRPDRKRPSSNEE